MPLQLFWGFKSIPYPDCCWHISIIEGCMKNFNKIFLSSKRSYFTINSAKNYSTWWIDIPEHFDELLNQSHNWLLSMIVNCMQKSINSLTVAGYWDTCLIVTFIQHVTTLVPIWVAKNQNGLKWPLNALNWCLHEKSQFLENHQ